MWPLPFPGPRPVIWTVRRSRRPWRHSLKTQTLNFPTPASLASDQWIKTWRFPASPSGIRLLTLQRRAAAWQASAIPVKAATNWTLQLHPTRAPPSPRRSSPEWPPWLWAMTRTSKRTAFLPCCRPAPWTRAQRVTTPATATVLWMWRCSWKN